MKSFGLGILLLSVAMFVGCGNKKEEVKKTEKTTTEKGKKDGSEKTTTETKEKKVEEKPGDKKMGDKGATPKVDDKPKTDDLPKTDAKKPAGDLDLDVSDELKAKNDKK